MTYSSSRRAARSGLLDLALACLALVGCAEGEKIDVLQRGSEGNGSGGDRGDGGRRNEGGARGEGGDGRASSSGDGGDPGSGPVASATGSSASNGAASSSSNGVSSSASNGASSSSAQSSAASSVVSSSAAQSSAAATSSSSGGGPIECNAPLDPGGDCGAGQHCWPEPVGVQPECSAAGSGTQYAGCGGELDCAPIYGCLPIVEGEGACCLQFCTNDFDCPSPDDLCYPFTDPLYAGGVEYGVCFDGFPAGC